MKAQKRHGELKARKSLPRRVWCLFFGVAAVSCGAKFSGSESAPKNTVSAPKPNGVPIAKQSAAVQVFANSVRKENESFVPVGQLKIRKGSQEVPCTAAYLGGIFAITAAHCLQGEGNVEAFVSWFTNNNGTGAFEVADEPSGASLDFEILQAHDVAILKLLPGGTFPKVAAVPKTLSGSGRGAGLEILAGSPLGIKKNYVIDLVGESWFYGFSTVGGMSGTPLFRSGQIESRSWEFVGVHIGVTNIQAFGRPVSYFQDDLMKVLKR